MPEYEIKKDLRQALTILRINRILLANRSWLVLGFIAFSTFLIIDIYWSFYSINELWFEENNNYFYHEFSHKPFYEDTSGYLNLLPRLLSFLIMLILKPDQYRFFAIIFKVSNIIVFSLMISVLLSKTFDYYLGPNLVLRALIAFLIILFPHHDIGYPFNSSLATLIPTLHIFLLLSDREKISKFTIIVYFIASPIIFVSKLIVVFASIALFCYSLVISTYRKSYAKILLSIFILTSAAFSIWYYKYYFSETFVNDKAFEVGFLKLLFNAVITSISAVGLSLSGYYFKLNNHGNFFIILSMFTGFVASCAILIATFFSFKKEQYQHFIKFFCALLLVIGISCISMLTNRHGYHNSSLMMYEIDRYFLHRYVFFSVISTLLCILCLITNYKELPIINLMAKILLTASFILSVYICMNVARGKISDYAVAKKPFLESAKDDRMISDFAAQSSSNLFKDGYAFSNTYDVKLQEVSFKGNVKNTVKIDHSEDYIRNYHRRLSPDKIRYLLLKIDGLPNLCNDVELEIKVKNNTYFARPQYIPTRSRFFIFKLNKELASNDPATSISFKKIKGCSQINKVWVDLI